MTAIVPALLACTTSWLWSPKPPAPAPQAAELTRLEFDVVEASNDKYRGSTAALSEPDLARWTTSPGIAPGDPVFRGDRKVGTVISVILSRQQGNLTVELVPELQTRVAVGDAVWVNLNPATERKNAK